MVEVSSAVDATTTVAAVALNVELAVKFVPLVIVTVYEPELSNGTITVAVIVPLRLALGAGLGRAEAAPIFRVLTVPRELNPAPVITIVSSTAASAGVITIVGFGVEKEVELPVMLPTTVVTI